MDPATFVAGFASCLSMVLFLLLAALLLHVSGRGRAGVVGNGHGVNRGQIEVFSTRVPAYMEPQTVKLLLETGHQIVSVRAINGSQLLDITAHRTVTR